MTGGRTGFVQATDGSTWMLGAGTTGTTWGYGDSTSTALTYAFTTAGDVEGTVKLGRKAGAKEISANLYIKFVKSKIGKVQQEKAKRRLKKLQNLVAYSKDIGQRALYEALCEEIAVLVRESTMVAYGIDKFIDIKDIEKFREIVKEKVIKFSNLKAFPRVIPKAVQAKIKKLEKAGVFDEFWILYIDYTKEPEKKTMKEKIRQKDPIVFGQFAHQKNKYYYIADWVDEYCDLTFDKFIEKFKDKDPEFGVDEVQDITDERWKLIVDEVKARHQRLEDTKSDNWREIEKKEAESGTKLKPDATDEQIEKRLDEILPPKKKKTWWAPWRK